MSRAKMRRKKAEGLVNQINNLADACKDARYVDIGHYEVVTIPPKLGVEVCFYLFLASLVAMIVLITVFGKHFEGGGVMSVFGAVLVMILLVGLVASLLSMLYNGRRCLTVRGPQEIGYSEREIQHLEEVLENADRTISQHRQEQEEKAKLMTRLRKLQYYIINVLDGKCELDEDEWIMRVDVAGMQSMYVSITDENYIKLVNEIVEFQQRKKLVQEFEKTFLL